MIDLCPSLFVSLQNTSSFRALLFRTNSSAYYSSSDYCNRLIPFLFPIILSVHQYLGHYFSKRRLDSACNAIRIFSERKRYLSATSLYFHSQFRQPIKHSNHILFIDTRHVSMPPLTEFSHTIHISIIMHAVVSWYSFRVSTLSFRISNYQIMTLCAMWLVSV